MASLSSIRSGLKTRLDTISEWNVYERWPNLFTAPGCIIEGVEAQHELTFGNSSARDLSEFTFELVVVASMSGGIENAQDALDEYVANTGARSVRAALDGDRTLGGVVHGLAYGIWNRPDVEEINGDDFLGRRLEVRIWSS